MASKKYKVTINQAVEVEAENEQEAKEYVAGNILDFIDWGDVEVTDYEEEK